MDRIIKNYWEIGLLIALALFITWPLFYSGYFSHHDDLHVMRIFEMRRCFADLQIPCRWVPDMGYGNGFPMFNYYSALPYYLGAFFSYILGFIGAAKVLFFIPLFFGGFTIYLLGKELYGRLGGLVTGVLYMYAPYRALDSYVRGAVAESFALFLIPLVFYLSYKLIKYNRYNFKLLALNALALAAFLTSHNIMTIMFLPILFVWVIFWIVIDKKYQSLKVLFLSFLIGVGISAFFLFPAYFEKNLVRTDTLTRFDLDFRAHFVTVNQILFSRYWGYGAAAPDHQDTISYQVGWPHWWLALIVFFISIYFSARLYLQSRVDNKRLIFLNLFFFITFLISLFMMHNKSAFVWERIDLLHYAQFPWRFLSVAIFTSSLLGGFLTTLTQGKLRYILVALIIGLTLILNYSFFHPGQYFYNLTDQEKLSGKLWDEQQKASLLDYLPKQSIEPRERAPDKPIVTSGKAQVLNFDNHSNRFIFNANVSSDSVIEMPVYDFPNWTMFVNGKEYIHDRQNLLGRIQIKLPKGSFGVEGVLENTLVRTISNIITIMSLVLLVVLAKYGKKLKLFRD